MQRTKAVCLSINAPFICHYSPGVEIVMVAEIGTVRVHFRQGSAADAVAATGEGGDLPVAQD